jgi:hypothetical protein
MCRQDGISSGTSNPAGKQASGGNLTSARMCVWQSVLLCRLLQARVLWGKTMCESTLCLLEHARPAHSDCTCPRLFPAGAYFVGKKLGRTKLTEIDLWGNTLC